MPTYREAGTRDWSVDGDRGTKEEIQIGCLQRIADGIEAMGKNVVALEADRDWWKRHAKEAVATNQNLRRRIAGLKGVLTRLKAKEK